MNLYYTALNSAEFVAVVRPIITDASVSHDAINLWQCYVPLQSIGRGSHEKYTVMAGETGALQGFCYWLDTIPRQCSLAPKQGWLSRQSHRGLRPVVHLSNACVTLVPMLLSSVSSTASGSALTTSADTR